MNTFTSWKSPTLLHTEFNQERTLNLCCSTGNSNWSELLNLIRKSNSIFSQFQLVRKQGHLQRVMLQKFSREESGWEFALPFPTETMLNNTWVHRSLLISPRPSLRHKSWQAQARCLIPAAGAGCAAPVTAFSFCFSHQHISLYNTLLYASCCSPAITQDTTRGQLPPPTFLKLLWPLAGTVQSPSPIICLKLPTVLTFWQAFFRWLSSNSLSLNFPYPLSYLLTTSLSH